MRSHSTWKFRLLRALRRLGLSYLAFRTLYAARLVDIRAILRNRRYSSRLADGEPPIPPNRAILLTTGRVDARGFIESGLLAARSIEDALARNALSLGAFDSVLDFGCGCGRVMRHWRGRSSITRFYGSDYNKYLIDCCRESLSFADFSTNGLEPPTAFADEKFDLVYALSVFTHMPEDLTARWVTELTRILRPGGYLLLSTHGEHFLWQLSVSEVKRFWKGELLVVESGPPGSNPYMAYHPEAYVRDKFASHLQLTDFFPGGAAGNGHQDLVSFRKPV